MSYNTVDLTAGLLFTLYRVLPQGSFDRLVVVDNGSTDGSVQVLEAMHRAGLLELVHNHWPQTHGPGLNRGVNVLARRRDVDLVWVLDSDVLVLRPDCLADAVATLDRERAALVGQMRPGGTYAHVSSNLFDPCAVWRRGVAPFWDDGEPGARMQRALRSRGLTVAEFPFYREGYALHIGGGTLQAVAERGETRSRYWSWANGLEQSGRHYHGNPRGAEIVATVARMLDQETDGLSGEALVTASMRPDRVGPL